MPARHPQGSGGYPHPPNNLHIERALAISSAIVWLVVFVLLAITELLSLVWLGDEAGPGDPALATFSVITRSPR
jgi:hypothetical protein